MHPTTVAALSSPARIRIHTAPRSTTSVVAGMSCREPLLASTSGSGQELIPPCHMKLAPARDRSPQTRHGDCLLQHSRLLAATTPHILTRMRSFSTLPFA